MITSGLGAKSKTWLIFTININIIALRGENMLKTTAMIMDELKGYANPTAKLARMVKAGEYTKIVRGLYETDPAVSGYLLAGSIYGPSYLSFDFALSFYGMIPEAAYAFTSATFDKKKKKSYDTPFGNFTYKDVPKEVYPYEIALLSEGEYSFQIATPEKALCDKLYSVRPAGSCRALKELLFEDLRIEEETLKKLSIEKIERMEDKYHSTNVELLAKVLKRMR